VTRWGILAALTCALALPASAHAQNYDAFDAVSFSDGANGVETAYTSAARLQVAAEFNSQNYGLDSSELPPTDRTGCGRSDGQFDVGGRSAWVRFLPGVAGTVRYDVSTPTFRSIVQVWTSDTALRGAVTPRNGPPAFVNVDCNSAQPIGGQYVTVRAEPNRPLWVQTLGYCNTGASAEQACPNNRLAAVGGPTRVLMTFTPDNDDNDVAPDTLDACRGVAGGAADGCPDSDADGVPDRLDQCDSDPGPAPTGCPPAPPPPPNDRDGDGVADSSDGCPALKGTAARKGCPSGLAVRTSAEYRQVGGGIQMLKYTVEAPKGSRVVVTCSRGCRRTVASGRGSKGVRIKNLSHRRLSNGTKITISVSVRGRLTTRLVDEVRNRRRKQGARHCYLPGTSKPRVAC
jgi:hypothetical protein